MNINTTLNESCPLCNFNKELRCVTQHNKTNRLSTKGRHASGRSFEGGHRAYNSVNVREEVLELGHRMCNNSVNVREEVLERVHRMCSSANVRKEARRSCAHARVNARVRTCVRASVRHRKCALLSQLVQTSLLRQQ